jgi:hypothetical protein
MPIVRLCEALAVARTFIYHIELPGAIVLDGRFG